VIVSLLSKLFNLSFKSFNEEDVVLSKSLMSLFKLSVLSFKSFNPEEVTFSCSSTFSFKSFKATAITLESPLPSKSVWLISF
jgi:hypothetical protein